MKRGNCAPTGSPNEAEHLHHIHTNSYSYDFCLNTVSGTINYILERAFRLEM